jgi:hypothetical protein
MFLVSFELLACLSYGTVILTWALVGSKYSSLFMDIQSTGYQGSGSAGAHS